MQVTVKRNNVNAALKKLKKKLFNEGIVKELQSRRFYEKPSDKKRRKKAEAKRRQQKEQQKRREELGV